MYCINCDKELDIADDIKYCPYCGGRIYYDFMESLEEDEAVEDDDEMQLQEEPMFQMLKNEVNSAKIYEPLIEGEWTGNVQKEKEVVKLLINTIGNSFKYGDRLFFQADYDDIPDKWSNFGERYDIRKPLLIYKYASGEDTDGFVVDAYQIAFCYVNDFEKYFFNQIQNVFYHKSLMMPAMHLKLKNGRISSPIYLYGMNNAESFVSRFRSFLFQINGVQNIDDVGGDIVEEENTEEKHIDELIKKICSANQYKSEYAEFGYPISQDSNRMAQAMGYFDVDLNMNTYLIYDSTLSDTCKEGFALCTDGFHFRYQKGTGTIPWKEFIDLKIKKFLNCVSVNGMIFSSAFETKKILRILLELQEYLKKEIFQ